jgi:hypothetical protein
MESSWSGVAFEAKGRKRRTLLAFEASRVLEKLLIVDQIVN